MYIVYNFKYIYTFCHEKKVMTCVDNECMYCNQNKNLSLAVVQRFKKEPGLYEKFRDKNFNDIWWKFSCFCV